MTVAGRVASGGDRRRSASASRAPEQLVAEVVDPGVGQRDAAVNFPSRYRVDVLDEQGGADAERERATAGRLATAREASLSGQAPSGRDWTTTARHRCACVDALHPDALPDAGGARIPDRMRMKPPVLLAARLGEIVRIVLSADDDFDAVAGRHMPCDIDAERQVPALVGRGKLLVHPHGRAIVDGPEVQDQALVGFQLQRWQQPAIPAGDIKARIADPARRRLGRKWHVDRLAPRDIGGLRPARVGVDREIPGTVQGRPVLAGEERARIATPVVIDSGGKPGGTKWVLLLGEVGGHRSIMAFCQTDAAGRWRRVASSGTSPFQRVRAYEDHGSEASRVGGSVWDGSRTTSDSSWTLFEAISRAESIKVSRVSPW